MCRLDSSKPQRSLTHYPALLTFDLPDGTQARIPAYWHEFEFVTAVFEPSADLVRLDSFFEAELLGRSEALLEATVSLVDAPHICAKAHHYWPPTQSFEVDPAVLKAWVTGQR